MRDHPDNDYSKNRPQALPLRLTEIGFEPKYKDVVGKPGGDIDYYGLQTENLFFRVYIFSDQYTSRYIVKCNGLGEAWQTEYRSIRTAATEIKNDLLAIAKIHETMRSNDNKT